MSRALEIGMPLFGQMRQEAGLQMSRRSSKLGDVLRLVPMLRQPRALTESGENEIVLTTEQISQGGTMALEAIRRLSAERRDLVNFGILPKKMAAESGTGRKRVFRFNTNMLIQELDGEE